MAENLFTLSWHSFQQNICSGLGSLQQNEDLVDMTLAADGHFVKVHQLVLSLASPYIKDLIKSAQCQNPVIFLNKISSTTLCSLLEYIYTGQVQVAKENLEELIEAAKALHIRGLMDMSYPVILSDTSLPTTNSSDLQNISESKIKKENLTRLYSHDDPFIHVDDHLDYTMDDIQDTDENLPSKNIAVGMPACAVIQKTGSPKESADILYSVSNKGNLQMIMNRFVYCLRYNGKSGQRQWRCKDYERIRCPATVTTFENTILKRASAHIHPFHDRTVAKKVRAKSIFSFISEAKKQCESLKEKKQKSDILYKT